MLCRMTNTKVLIPPDIAHLLVKVAASELLACDVNRTVLTVSEEDGTFDRPDYERTVSAIVNCDL